MKKIKEFWKEYGDITKVIAFLAMSIGLGMLATWIVSQFTNNWRFQAVAFHLTGMIMIFFVGGSIMLREIEKEEGFNSLKHEAAKMSITVVEYVTRQLNTIGINNCEYIVFQCQFQGGTVIK